MPPKQINRFVRQSPLCRCVFTPGSGRDHGGGGAERDTAVSLSSAAHRRTVHTGNAHARVRASVCVSICVVTLWFVFFPLQVVLSTCLCFWFCLLPVSGWFGDARGGGRRQPQFLLRIASRPLTFNFCSSFHPSITGRSMLTALSCFLFFLLSPANNSPSSSPRFLQICSRPLPPIQVLCHLSTASISRAGTPGETAAPKTVPRP